MSEEMLIHHCAPTLAGIKTGSLFTCRYESRRQVLENISRLNRRLVPLGLRVLPLRYSRDRVLVYVYRPSSLAADLRDAEARRILAESGYTSAAGSRCVMELIRRLNACGGCFPHEIGLFLSYPPEDVRGFIENKGSGCKCVGCWKVYGDEVRAKYLFEQYRRCTEDYRSLWCKGASMECLAVAG